MSLKLTILGILFALFAGIYQIYLSPLVDGLGLFYTVQPFGLKESHCSKIADLQACEKLVLHQPSGILYLACSSPESRVNWLPAVGHLVKASKTDYIATFDPNTSQVTRLALESFDSVLNVHGMDVVPSSSDPSELFVYLVNHRPPTDGQDASKVGADSVIEVFKTTMSAKSLIHLRTVEDPAIICPNDIAGFSDGKRFYFTNDNDYKTGFGRSIRAGLFPSSSVGYCQVDQGCKIAVPDMLSSNGIAKAVNDTVYVASTLGKKLSIFEKQEDDSLVLTDVIPLGTFLDNVAIDNDGYVWLAGFPKGAEMTAHMDHPERPASGCAWKVSVNTGPSSFYGEKYKVEKVFEDNGKIASGSTSAVYDSERRRLFLHGVCAPHLTMCNL